MTNFATLSSGMSPCTNLCWELPPPPPHQGISKQSMLLWAHVLIFVSCCVLSASTSPRTGRCGLPLVVVGCHRSGLSLHHHSGHRSPLLYRLWLLRMLPQMLPGLRLLLRWHLRLHGALWCVFCWLCDNVLSLLLWRWRGLC